MASNYARSLLILKCYFQVVHG